MRSVEPNKVQPIRPCESIPCGNNAQCQVHPLTGSPSCICPPDYRGDPYVSCRPECVINSDCPRNRGCLVNRCIDPCPGVCGPNAICHVANHQPICGCPDGYRGDPYRSCQPLTAISKRESQLSASVRYNRFNKGSIKLINFF